MSKYSVTTDAGWVLTVGVIECEEGTDMVEIQITSDKADSMFMRVSKADFHIVQNILTHLEGVLSRREWEKDSRAEIGQALMAGPRDAQCHVGSLGATLRKGL